MEYTITLFSPLVEHAIELASEWHDRTYRKGRWRDPSYPVPTEEALRVPVMAHLTAVAIIVKGAGWDDETVAAAFLHDIIEDGNRFREYFRYESLVSLVGSPVADLVREVSEDKLDDDGIPRRWKDRKIGYIDRLSSASDRAHAISLADKIHNLWSINETMSSGINVFENGPDRKALSANPSEQLWFYESVLEATRTGKDERLVPMRMRLEEEIQRFREFV
ncbi:MAG: HD domain-containing protein [Rhodothermales bacterium]|nr:HD domain-containing protein [Rhodothermales bacterium]